MVMMVMMLVLSAWTSQNGNDVDATCLDKSKAFDKVNYNKYCSK